MSSDSLYANLSEYFPEEMVKQVRKGSANLDYIPVSEIVNRLNTVLGVDKWGLNVLRVQRDDIDPEFVVAHVRLWFFNDDGVRIERDGMGGQKINRKSAGEIVDLGDDFKGAVSDGIKKAASSLGVGLYLSRDDDAIEAEQAQAAPRVEPKPNADAEVDAAWTLFIGQSRSLNDDQKKELNKFWDEYSGGRPKPTRESASLDDLKALSAEVVRITFDATPV